MASATAYNNSIAVDLTDDDDDRKPRAREDRVIDLTSNLVDLTNDDNGNYVSDVQSTRLGRRALARLKRRKEQSDADEAFAKSLAASMEVEEFTLQQSQMEIDAALAKSIQEEEEKNLKRRNEAQAAKVAAIAAKKLKVAKKEPPAIITKHVGEITYAAPQSLTLPEDPFEPVPDNLSSVDECACCLENLDRTVVKSNICPHQFHEVCLRECLQVDLQCPICRRAMEEPKRGTSPSSTMTISVSSHDCSGFPGVGTIHIKYSTVGGQHQRSYHIRPGSPFKGLELSSLLPSNKDGRGLLKRIEYAFKRGLLFDVVEETITEPGAIPNPCTAACAKHTESLTSTTNKTWSDSGYFKKCHQILDDMKVPTSDALCHDSNMSAFDL